MEMAKAIPASFVMHNVACNNINLDPSLRSWECIVCAFWFKPDFAEQNLSLLFLNFLLGSF